MGSRSEGAGSAKPAKKRKLPKNEVTRSRILESAARVFQEKGYSLARLSDIAELAGIHAGGIYYHFDSRESLVEAVLNESTTRVADLVSSTLAHMPENATVLQKLREAIRAHLEFLHRNDNFVLAYLKIIDQVTPEIRDRHQLFEADYGALWQRIILEGQEAGLLRRDLDPTMVRLLLLGSLQWTLEWFRASGRHRVSTLADHAAEMFLNGLRAQ